MYGNMQGSFSVHRVRSRCHISHFQRTGPHDAAFDSSPVHCKGSKKCSLDVLVLKQCFLFSPDINVDIQALYGPSVLVRCLSSAELLLASRGCYGPAPPLQSLAIAYNGFWCELQEKPESQFPQRHINIHFAKNHSSITWAPQRHWKNLLSNPQLQNQFQIVLYMDFSFVDFYCGIQFGVMVKTLGQQTEDYGLQPHFGTKPAR